MKKSKCIAHESKSCWVNINVQPSQTFLIFDYLTSKNHYFMQTESFVRPQYKLKVLIVKLACKHDSRTVKLQNALAQSGAGVLDSLLSEVMRAEAELAVIHKQLVNQVREPEE